MNQVDFNDPDEASSDGTNIVPGDPNIMTSLVRGLAVIQAFSGESPSLSISQISQKTDIPRAAVRRCLYTLRALGFADSPDGRLYELCPRILALGYAYLRSFPIATVAQPVLRRISSALQESSSIAVLDGDDIVYIARSSASRIMTVDLQVGSKLPALFTSMGRVLLAFRSDGLEDRLARAEFAPWTPHTIKDAAALRTEIEHIRTAGYSIVDQELEVGLRSIAVPIFAPDGSAVAAINVGAHVSRISIDYMIEKIRPLILKAASELSLCF